MKKVILLSGILVLLFAACKKTDTASSTDTKDTTPPSLVLTDPSTNSMWYDGQKLAVEAVCTDDIELKSCNIEIVSATGIPSYAWSTTSSISITGKNQTAHSSIDILSNVFPGSYIVKASCTDAAGNSSSVSEHTVNIKDTIRPTLTYPVSPDSCYIKMGETIVLSGTLDSRGLLSKIEVTAQGTGRKIATINDNIGISSIGSMYVIETGNGKYLQQLPSVSIASSGINYSTQIQPDAPNSSTSRLYLDFFIFDVNSNARENTSITVKR